MLNHKGYFSAENQRRVEEAVTAVGYTPTAAMRAATQPPARLVGVIIPDISNVFYTSVASALLTVLSAAGVEMILCVNNEDAHLDLQHLQMLVAKGVDGILYAHPAQGDNSVYVRQLAAQGFPIVEFNRQREKELLDAVLPDNFRGVHRAVEYLAELGHRRIGFVSGSTAITTGSERLLGYQNAVRQFDLDDDPALTKIGAFSRAHGEHATEQLLDLASPPTALIAGSNRISMGALMVIGQRGIHIPDQLSVVGYNDTEWLTAWNPPITAVDIAVDEMAKLAVDLVLHRIANRGAEAKPVTYHLSTSLIVRRSCRSCSVYQDTQ
ncbi:MAG: LacI family DNA-binding transcriptional regulator [Anaerolineales bacterium]|nr:LacI family DNA-binding transcriptional regulator [Anaerolineales bacterium]